MKAPSLEDLQGEGESSGDSKITNAIVEALTANDKVIEIRPADQSKGMGPMRLLLLGAGAIALAYWVQNSQKPDEIIGSVKEKTAERTQQAAQTVEEGSENASERIKQGSENASERIKQGSENASERIEEGSERAGEAVQDAGETVAERTEEAGEKAAEETDSDDEDSSRP